MAGKPDKPKTLKLRQNPRGQGIILTVLAFLALGVVAVYSTMATVAEPGKLLERVDVKHAIFAGMAGLVLLTFWRFDYRRFGRGKRLPWLAFGLLVLALIMCALVFAPGIGYSKGGKFRWIRIWHNPVIQIQPSEVLKIAVVIFLAAWLTRPKIKIRSIWTFLIAGGVTLACVGIVITQDFGTALLIGLTAGVVMLLAGVPWFYLASVLPPAALGAYYLAIKTPYRLQRILAMMDPWNSTNPSAYQSQQSLMAIRSGGWEGVGLGNGVRKLGFLPEDSTDFIFASFCEEWGFRGAMMLMSMILVWMWQCRKAASQCVDPLGKVLAAAFGAMITIQALLHIGINMVMLPPTGMSMPFVSAGGSSLMIMTFSAAMIVSVTAHPSTDTPEEQEMKTASQIGEKIASPQTA